jgi:3-mercaptopyruvate sulfurtransferase SseA
VALNVIDLGMDPENVYVLLGGFDVWQAAGYPTASGNSPP